MAYENNNSSSSNTKKSTNTSGLHFTNSKASTPSALNIQYWDDSVRIEFCPELPKDQQTENRRYDYTNTIKTALPRAKCNEFYNAYRSVVRPAIEKGEDATIGITLASVNLLVVGSGVVDGVPHPYLALYKNLDADTLIAPKSSSVKYEFNTGEYILGYEPETGKFKERIVTCNEVDLFFNDLNSARIAYSNAFVHTDRVVNRYRRDSMDNKINQIGEKLGLELATTVKSYGNGGRGSIFDHSQGQNSNYKSTASTATSLEDIDKAIAGLC